MVRVRTAIGTLALCALLGACSAAGAEPPGLPTSPTTASTPTPTPTPTPSPTATELTTHDLSDPKLGIVFVDTPNLTGAAASAHDAVAIFEREYWRSLTTGTVSPLIFTLASGDIQDLVENSVRTNAKRGNSFSGTERITIRDVRVTGARATVDICPDYSGVTFHHSDGTPDQSAKQAGLDHRPVIVVGLSSVDEGVTWHLQSYADGKIRC